MEIGKPRILIGTLYCGENEYSQCKISVEKQNYENWSHIVIKDMPNDIAHKHLYSTFMNYKNDYDIFIKLDADMIFDKYDILTDIVKLFLNNPDADHVSIPVYDWFSDSYIWGMHAYSNKVFWPEFSENLFVDPNPIIPGVKLKIKKDLIPNILHSPNPSPYQAFHFGIHRGLKTVQRNQSRIRYHKIMTHWRILNKTWDHFTRTKNSRLGFAVLGGDLAINGDVGGVDIVDKYDSLQNLFENFKNWKQEALFEYLTPRWNPGLRKNIWFTKNIGTRWVKGKIQRLIIKNKV